MCFVLFHDKAIKTKTFSAYEDFFMQREFKIIPATVYIIPDLRVESSQKNPNTQFKSKHD